MSLTAYIPPENPVTGVSGDKVKPITEGYKVMATEEQESGGGFWSGLDDLGGNILSGIGNLAGAIADREADSIRTGVEGSFDTTGDPSDQPGSVTAAQVEESFISKYKTPILIGGGLLVATTLFLAFKGK